MKTTEKPKITMNPRMKDRFTGEKIKPSWHCGDSMLSGYTPVEAYRYWVNWQRFKAATPNSQNHQIIVNLTT